MTNIQSKIDVDELKEQINLGKLFLGICVGMQVLATAGYEFEKTNGLGILPGEVISMESHGESLPHVGWNSVEQQRASQLFKGIPDNKDFYFTHSYKLQAHDLSNELGLTHYGQPFISVINEQNIFGVQFHPEKSQFYGLELLRNFSRIQ
jgi:glutamine amidotransferase